MDNKVSIIVPVYNQEKYLKKCIESIINQTYENIEILIIDDGSKDNSYKIIKEYQKNDNRIIGIKKSNTGVSDTRNVGIKKATGKYLMFVDSDDWIEKTTVEKLVKKIKTEKVDVIRYNSITYSKQGIKKYDSLYELSNKKLTKNDFNKFLRHIFYAKENIACYSPTLFLHRNKSPLFDVTLKYMEDMVYYIDLLSCINTIYFYDLNLYNYRYNEKSVTKNSLNQLNSIYNIIDTIIVLKKKSMMNYQDILNRLAFTLSIGKIDNYLYCNNNRLSTQIKNIKKIIQSKEYSEVCLRIEIKELTLDKKIEYILLKKNKYFLFILLEKIKHLIKSR